MVDLNSLTGENLRVFKDRNASTTAVQTFATQIEKRKQTQRLINGGRSGGDNFRKEMTMVQ